MSKTGLFASVYSLLDHPRAYSVVQGILSLGNRATERSIQHLLRPSENDRLLDIGCGPGRYAHLFQHCFYVGIDLNFRFLGARGIPSSAHFIQGNIAELCFQDESFHFIICVGVLHHLSPNHVCRTLSSIKRVLTQGGFAYVFEPVYPRNPFNWVGRALFALDRGQYTRKIETLNALMLENSFKETSYQATARETFPHEQRIYVFQKA